MHSPVGQVPEHQTIFSTATICMPPPPHQGLGDRPQFFSKRNPWDQAHQFPSCAWSMVAALLGTNQSRDGQPEPSGWLLCLLPWLVIAKAGTDIQYSHELLATTRVGHGHRGLCSTHQHQGNGNRALLGWGTESTLFLYRLEVRYQNTLASPMLDSAFFLHSLSHPTPQQKTNCPSWNLNNSRLP